MWSILRIYTNKSNFWALEQALIQLWQPQLNTPFIYLFFKCRKGLITRTKFSRSRQFGAFSLWRKLRWKSTPQQVRRALHSRQSPIPSPCATLGNHPGFRKQLYQTLPHGEKTPVQRNWCTGMLLYPTSRQQPWRTPTILCHQYYRQGLEVLESQTSKKPYSSSSTVASGSDLDTRSPQTSISLPMACTHNQTVQYHASNPVYRSRLHQVPLGYGQPLQPQRWADDEPPVCACSALRQHTYPADQHLVVDGDALHFIDKLLTSVAAGSLQNKNFPASKEIYKSLRAALATWTKRNSLPSLRHSDLEDLWKRSLQSHHASLLDHITHKDIIDDSNNSSPMPSSTTRTSGPLLFEYSAQWSTMNASPRPSPIR